jgi:2-polyprenyl-3-methyl-5-hydroxy-6-metoxy-1,4-benzoquinol methylase
MEKYIIPFLKKTMEISPNMHVAEVGCSMGGNLKPFLDLGCKKIVGIDINENSIKKAELNFNDHPNRKNLTLIHSDIYDIDYRDFKPFDLIFLKDTLEHIPNQELFLNHIKKFLKKDGKLFLAFPPWKMPFGGHQQICSSILNKVPYFHILPKNIYKYIMKLFGEKDSIIKSLLETKETHIHLYNFKKIIFRQNFDVVKSTLFIINPNYKVKFGLKPVKLPFFMNIPFISDFFITTCYYVLKLNLETI